MSMTAAATRANASLHGAHCAQGLASVRLHQIFSPPIRLESWALLVTGTRLRGAEHLAQRCPSRVSTSKAAALVEKHEGSGCCFCYHMALGLPSPLLPCRFDLLQLCSLLPLQSPWTVWVCGCVLAMCCSGPQNPVVPFLWAPRAPNYL